ncbi:MAG: GyrI-like domain-containing protein [Defluviitaleaceae bacterium]|nr:GyrI-like domain-containing protein [Defluviitaleaceae bacterium]
MEPRVVKVEPMRMVGVVLKTSMEEVAQNNPIPTLWSQIFTDGRRDILNKLKGNNRAEYGVCIVHDDDSMEYVIAVELEKFRFAPKDFYKCEIPGGEYLAVETTTTTLGEAWMKITKWLDENGYEIAHGTSFEYYDQRMNEEEMKFDIYAPIVKA